MVVAKRCVGVDMSDAIEYKGKSLPVGQQRIAVMPTSQIYPIIEAQPEWTDSLVWAPNSVTRVQHANDYRQQEEIVAEAGSLRLVRHIANNGKRYRQGV
jgi:hypothetical protein